MAPARGASSRDSSPACSPPPRSFPSPWSGGCKRARGRQSGRCENRSSGLPTSRRSARSMAPISRRRSPASAAATSSTRSGAGSGPRARRSCVGSKVAVGSTSASSGSGTAGSWETPRRSAPAARPGDPRATEIVEDLFWLRLLTPLLELPPDELQSSLRTILSREHRHPILGPSKLVRADVLARLRWAQSVDPADLLTRYREVHLASRSHAERGVRPDSLAQEVSL